MVTSVSRRGVTPVACSAVQCSALRVKMEIAKRTHRHLCAFVVQPEKITKRTHWPLDRRFQDFRCQIVPEGRAFKIHQRNPRHPRLDENSETKPCARRAGSRFRVQGSKLWDPNPTYDVRPRKEYQGAPLVRGEGGAAHRPPPRTGFLRNEPIPVFVDPSAIHLLTIQPPRSSERTFASAALTSRQGFVNRMSCSSHSF
jgi:hypothetical protein